MGPPLSTKEPLINLRVLLYCSWCSCTCVDLSLTDGRLAGGYDREGVHRLRSGGGGATARRTPVSYGLVPAVVVFVCTYISSSHILQNEGRSFWWCFFFCSWPLIAGRGTVITVHGGEAVSRLMNTSSSCWFFVVLYGSVWFFTVLYGSLWFFVPLVLVLYPV